VYKKSSAVLRSETTSFLLWSGVFSLSTHGFDESERFGLFRFGELINEGALAQQKLGGGFEERSFHEAGEPATFIKNQFHAWVRAMRFHLREVFDVDEKA
jgi:hypothetical protein